MTRVDQDDEARPAIKAGLRKRQRFQGVLQIVRFNWPLYATAGGVVVLLPAALRTIALPVVVRSLVWVGILLLAFWMVSSLAISHWVYDRAGIYELGWVKEALTEAPARWANLHAGFDEFTSSLRALFPQSVGLNWDFHHVKVMTERSIARARRMATGAPPAVKVNYVELPERDGALDAAFLIFSAHELRSRLARDQFFRELSRTLRAGGSLLLVEHLRDGPNFLAFGFGAFHFLSRREWSRVATSAGFKLEREVSITPFVRVFQFRRPT